jgi:large subunit ribosomal protein L24e
MPEIKKCTFCGNGMEPGTGKMYVKKDGTIQYYCSSKCQNNMKLGRVPRLVEWVSDEKKEKKQLQKKSKK